MPFFAFGNLTPSKVSDLIGEFAIFIDATSFDGALENARSQDLVKEKNP
jgi:hypothetical protein